jgi:alkaline phosphatase D
VWLKDEQDKRGAVPKFIVSSSVFAPNPIGAREGRQAKDGNRRQEAKWKEASDSWPAFPTTRRELLQSIVDNQVQNVVFLSGDIHVSNVAALEFSGTPEAAALKAFSITSSAFYWPFPFADGDPAGYVHDSRLQGQEDTFEVNETVKLDYKAWNFTQEDNFCRVDIDHGNHRLVVVPYNDEGERIQGGGFFGYNAQPLEARLDLAAW